MSQSDSLQSPLLDSGSEQFAPSKSDPDESVELSHWTSTTPAKLQVLEADLQLLESAAEDLMDELFPDEVNHSPTHGSGSSSAAIVPLHSALTLRTQPATSFPLLAPARSADPLDQPLQVVYLEDVPVAENGSAVFPAFPEPVDPALAQLNNLQKQRWQDLVLLGSGAAALCLITMGLLVNWLNGRSHWSSSSLFASQDSRSRPDAFWGYLRQSLQQVNRTPGLSEIHSGLAQSTTPVLTSSTVSVSSSLPTLIPPATGQPNTPPRSRGSATRVVTPPSFVPQAPRVSQAPPPVPSTVALPQIPIATLPPPPPMGESALAPSPPNLVATSPSGSLPLIPPANLGEALPPIPKPPSTGPANVAVPSKMATPPSSNRLARTLTGVMQMGDQSLALIEVNGVTRRIRLGEVITADGAVLLQVGDQEAIVQKGAEQYTIQVGQRF